MTHFFDKMKEELQQLAQHNEVLKMKEKAAELIHQASIPVPLTSKMLQTLIVQAQIEDIQQIKVDITEKGIKIEGMARKLLLKIPFSMLLSPASVHGRTLVLNIVEMTPLNQNWLNQLIFHHPPHLNYRDGCLNLDLNEFEVINQMKLGVIKEAQIKDHKLWLKIGI